MCVCVCVCRLLSVNLLYLDEPLSERLKLNVFKDLDDVKINPALQSNILEPRGAGFRGAWPPHSLPEECSREVPEKKRISTAS